jgi:hypothetical protein
MTEEEQLALVSGKNRAGSYNITRDELACLKQRLDGSWTFVDIVNPTKKVIRAALNNPLLIRDALCYEYVVKQLFANNVMLMKKWLRHGETMRMVI